MDEKDFGYVMHDDFRMISPHDHNLWMKLFYLAEKFVGRDLCDRLQYLRNCGCRLEVHPQYGYVIRPVIGPFSWNSKNQYNEERKCLNPYKDKVVWLLKRLATEKIGFFS